MEFLGFYIADPQCIPTLLPGSVVLRWICHSRASLRGEGNGFPVAMGDHSSLEIRPIDHGTHIPKPRQSVLSWMAVGIIGANRNYNRFRGYLSQKLIAGRCIRAMVSRLEDIHIQIISASLSTEASPVKRKLVSP